MIKFNEKYPELSKEWLNKHKFSLMRSIKKQNIDLFNKINDFYGENFINDVKFSEKLYLFMNNLISIPKCQICNKVELKFKGFDLGYGKYCNKCSSKAIETKIKQKETFMKNYGVDNIFKSKKFIADQKIKNLKKIGVDNISKLKETKEKIKKTNLNKIGKISNLLNLSNESIIKRKQSLMNNNIKYINDKINNNEYTYNGEQIERNYIIHHNKCNNKFKINRLTLFSRINNNEILCTKCNSLIKPISNLEKELFNFINDEFGKDLKIESNIYFNENKKRYELDIYLPQIKLGIEFNGLYWHSVNAGKEKNYHINKLDFFEKKDIRLIQIFEDEWLFKKNIVKERLFHIIKGSLKKINITIEGQQESIMVGARKTKIKEINYKDSKEFLEKYHIQGGDRSKIKYGAFYNDELIGVMTFGKSSLSKGGKKILKEGKNIFELNRFAIKKGYNIPGLANKMLSYFQKENKSVDTIFSYADRRWSQGDVYRKIGFTLISKTKPNYYYFKSNENIRYHRFNFRKQVLLKNYPIYITKINKLTNKLYTEEEIMNELKYYQIYDAGNLKFILNNK